ncbi:hypothetical protein NC661_17880 [Aquibacillus koreensis]|uniref:Uncharacterized protein n=1 Tax=Aquibacillus koreensis TaxID=279446 RepID=A0A9X3WM05_9BACI|nr:hypothetical protein [Aquibacillus koreensis]MCT2536224.1 hypothetical protein [Aquibacillus koreensis]MDC3422222.1 hypothetical protein [Aquibacillus koreensis]
MKKKAFLLIISVLLFGIFLSLLVYFKDIQRESESVDGNDIPIVHAEANYVADFTDERNLLGTSTNAFIGKVIEKEGEEDLKSHTETRFSVKVKNNIKGKVNGVVTISQMGGYTTDKNGNKVLILTGDDELLIPGEEYFFATIYIEEFDRYNIVSEYGDVKIEGNEKAIINKYKQAYKNEKIPEVIKSARQSLKEREGKSLSKEEIEKLNKEDKEKLQR